MVKWVAGLAILAAFLGIVGTVAIISHLHTLGNKVKPQDEIKKEIQNTQITDTPKVTAQAPPLAAKAATVLPAANSVAVIKKEDTIHTVAPLEKENPEIPAQLPVNKTDEKKPVDKVEVKDNKKLDNQKDVKKDHKQNLLNEKELRQVFVHLNRVKAKFNIYSNCVQLFTSEQSNNSRATRQVETFLRNRHFTIAGRETIPNKVKGIKITPAGGCIRVTIGTF